MTGGHEAHLDPGRAARITARRARGTVGAFLLLPLAIALALPVWRIGEGRRGVVEARLISAAERAADTLRAGIMAGAADAAPAAFATLDDSTHAAYYDAATDWSAVALHTAAVASAAPAPDAALPATPPPVSPFAQTLSARVLEELESLDRPVATRVRGRLAAASPVKDADAWDVIGALVVVRTTPDPRRFPAGPAAVALAAWVLTALFALLAVQLRAPWRRVGLYAAPLAGVVVLGRWPGPGTHGLWAVLGISGWAVSAGIGSGLAALASRPLAWREARRAWAFLAPSLAHLLVFSLGPIVFSLWLSFHEWDLLAQARPFVGLANYRELAGDAAFLRALRNTAVYVLFVPVGMVVALALALLVDRRVPGVRLLRATFFLPYITSFVAISLIWRWMFEPDIGLLNNLLARVGIPAQPWLSSPATALPSLMLMSVWMYAGYMMILFLAGLQSIPASLYEAARIDGANAWQRFRRITLPLLRPTALFVLVTMVIFMFQVFTAVYVMTEGGPLHATDVIVYHIYRNAWEYLRMGYASAMAWVLFALVFLITLVQFRWLGARTPT